MENYTIIYADGKSSVQPIPDKLPLGIIFNGNLILLREFEMRCKFIDALEFLPEINIAGTKVKTYNMQDDFFKNLTMDEFEKINQLLVQLKGSPIKRLRFYWTSCCLCNRYQKVVSFCRDGIRQKFVEPLAKECHYVRPIVPLVFIQALLS